MTALFLAARGGHEAVVRLLLEKGADVNAKAYLGRTALHVVAEGEDVYRTHVVAEGEAEAVMQLLLEKGADVNAKDEDGVTVQDVAAERGYEALVQLLAPLSHISPSPFLISR